MINKPNGYDKAKAFTESTQLPPGAYVVKILNTKVESFDWGQRLVLQIDIAEGDLKDFFKNQYDAQQQEDKKWKGSYRRTVPTGDGSERDNWSMRSFKADMNAIEDSNNGYAWDWDENSLKGKIVGALFNRKEFVNGSGEVITFTQCKRLIAADNVRSGHYKLPKDDLLKEKPQEAPADNGGMPAGFAPVNDDDIPF